MENKIDETQASEFKMFHRAVKVVYLSQMLSQSFEIMRAPRSATNRTSGDSKPRPIHIYLLRYKDRQFILAKAAKTLKDISRMMLRKAFGISASNSKKGICITKGRMKRWNLHMFHGQFTQELFIK